MRAPLAPLFALLVACGDKNTDDTAGSGGSRPVAVLLSPESGDRLTSGAVVTFEGLVDDAEDAAGALTAGWTLDGEEACAADAPAADGRTTCVLAVPDLGDLGGDSVLVELWVEDSSGAVDTASVSVTVVSSEAPDVVILSPDDQAVAYADTPLVLAGVATDDLDAAADLVATWSSDVDGVLDTLAVGAGGAADTEARLSTGTHTLTLAVEDTVGHVGEDSVVVTVFDTNTAPACGITAPLDGAAARPGDTVTLTATVSDAEDGPSGLLATWSSDRDGLLGTGSPGGFDTVQAALEGLSEGVHTLSLAVVDSGGLTCADAISFTVGNAPEITLTAPSSGSVHDAGEPVRFAAVLADDLDRPDALTVTWTSDVDGLLTTTSPDADGTTAFTTTALSVGAHTVTLQATDTDGFSNVAAVALTINGLPTAPAISLSPDPAYTTDDLTVSIDTDSVDPEGATVTYAYAWAVDGVAVPETSATLGASAFAAGQVVTATVTPNDGTSDGAAASISVVIDNTAPVLASVALTPDPATEGDTLVCTPGAATDADGDGVSFTYAWSIDGVDPGVTADTLDDGWWASGEAVVCTVTPDDGADAGAAVASNTVVIGNAAPSILSVAITPASPGVADDLTCAYAGFSDPDGDADQSTFAWTVNGASAGTSATLAAGSFANGDTVACTVTPDDGTDAGTALAATVVIGNSAPSITSVSISPAAAAVGDTLTCSYSGFSDADGDADQSTLRWTVNGVAAGTSSTLAGGFTGGDTVACTVTPFDGASTGTALSSSLVVDNTLPVVAGVTLAPDPAYEGDTLTCTPGAATDADGDTVSLAFAWTVDGVAQTATGRTLSSASFDRDDAVICTVTPRDGVGTGASVASNTVTVSNTAPTVSTVAVSPSAPTVTSTLTCSYSGFSDVDGDADASTFRWTVGGVEVGTSSTLSSGFAAGDAVVCAVTPHDGTDAGAPVTDSVTVYNTPPSIASVAITPATPTVDDALVCAATATDPDGDTVTISYAWTVGGVAAGTGSTLSSGFSKGDAVVCAATPSDGTTHGTPATDAVVVANAVPSIASVAITPDPATVSDTLTCSYTGFSDSDGDADASTVRWTAGGVEVGTSSTLSGAFSAGDTVVCTVTPGDGTDTGAPLQASLVVENTPPALTGVSISPSTATVADPLTCAAAATDADGDAVTLSYSWTVGGAEVGTSSTLSSGFVAGDTVTCTVTPDDGVDAGASDSASVTIDNALPVLSGVSLTPTTAYEADTLNCTPGSASDADGDSISYGYAWAVGGVAAASTSSTLTGAEFDRGDAVVCTVTPSDGTDAGVPVVSNSVTIANSPPVMASVAVSPPAPTVADTLTCTPSAADDDGDSITYGYRWTIAGTVVGTSSTLSSGFTAGDTVSCAVTPTDGTDAGTAATDSVVVLNTPPVLGSVTVTPTSPVVTDTLTCAATSTDVDGDPVSYAYSWTIGGVEVGTASTLAGAFAAADTVTCTVTPSDGTDDGASDTDHVTVRNSAPVLTSVSLTPTTAYEGSTLTCSPTATDVDGDTLTYGYAWTVAGATLSATSSTLTGADFDEADTVSCTVTPNDGTTDGASLTSNAVTISNTAPSVASVSISPAAPQVGDTLTCSYAGFSDADGDADQSTYSWTIGGTEVGTSSTLSSGYSKGDTVVCTVTPYDGDEVGAAVGDSVVLLNTAPTLSTVSVSPTSPAVNDTLTCSYGGFSDDDGDADQSTYSWTVGGTEVGTSSTLSSGFSKGDAVTCTVTPFDGEDAGAALADSVTAVDSAPVMVSVTLSPVAPTEDDTVTCTPSATDADGDSITYAYAWTVDGSAVSVTGNTLDGADFDHGDVVVCAVTPTADSVSGAALASSGLTIVNSPPVLGSVTVGPALATATDTLTCTPTGSDADGDTILYAYSWTIGGTEVGTAATLSGVTTGGDTVVCTVTPSDADDTGTARSGSILIQNSAPVTVTVTITPTEPTVEDPLVCLAAGTDADGDAISFTYEWSVGGSTIGTGSTISSGYSRADLVTCAATPNDGVTAGTVGSTTETIENALPRYPSVSIAPTSPTVGSTLTASFTAYDADGDPVSTSYAWFVDGTQVATTPSLDVGTHASKGDDIEVRLTPDDGTEAGLVGVSNSVTVANSAPTTPTVDATDDPVDGVDDILCEVTVASTDADADSVTYVFEWEADGSVYPDDFPTATGPDTTTFTDDTVPAADTALASEWTCFVYATDGTDSSSDASDTSTVVATSAPLSGGGNATCDPNAGQSHGTGNFLGIPITLSSAATVTDFGITVGTLDDDASRAGWTVPSAILGLYTDSGGGPGSLLAESARESLVEGDNVLAADSAVAVSAGTYWIVYELDNIYNNVYIADCGGSATAWYSSASSGSPTAMPSSAGAGATFSFADIGVWIEGY